MAIYRCVRKCFHDGRIWNPESKEVLVLPDTEKAPKHFEIVGGAKVPELPGEGDFVFADLSNGENDPVECEVVAVSGPESIMVQNGEGGVFEIAVSEIRL